MFLKVGFAPSFACQAAKTPPRSIEHIIVNSATVNVPSLFPAFLFTFLKPFHLVVKQEVEERSSFPPFSFKLSRLYRGAKEPGEKVSSLYALFASVETRVEVNIPACTCDQSARHLLTACKIKIIESVLCSDDRLLRAVV